MKSCLEINLFQYSHRFEFYLYEKLITVIFYLTVKSLIQDLYLLYWAKIRRLKRRLPKVTTVAGQERVAPLRVAMSWPKCSKFLAAIGSVAELRVSHFEMFRPRLSQIVLKQIYKLYIVSAIYYLYIVVVHIQIHFYWLKLCTSEPL